MNKSNDTFQNNATYLIKIIRLLKEKLKKIESKKRISYEDFILFLPMILLIPAAGSRVYIEFKGLTNKYKPKDKWKDKESYIFFVNECLKTCQDHPSLETFLANSIYDHKLGQRLYDYRCSFLHEGKLPSKSEIVTTINEGFYVEQETSKSHKITIKEFCRQSIVLIEAAEYLLSQPYKAPS